MKRFLFTIVCVAVLYLSYHFNVIAFSYNAIRPLVLEDGGQGCLQQLQEEDIKFQQLGLIKNNYCM